MYFSHIITFTICYIRDPIWIYNGALYKENNVYISRSETNICRALFSVAVPSIMNAFQPHTMGLQSIKSDYHHDVKMTSNRRE